MAALKPMTLLQVVAMNFVVLTIAGLSASCAKMGGGSLADELANLAAKIPFINAHDVVYQRIPYEARFLMDDRERSAFEAFMDLVETADEPQLWELTRGNDARIRTLAIIGVYWQGNSQRLPGLLALIKDDAKTFPACESMRSDLPVLEGSVEERRRKWGVTDQTVGSFAREIINEYLRIAGFEFEEGSNAEKFDRYWAARGDRKYCLSWFELALRRATHRSTPLQKECLPAVRKLRNRVAALEPPYRGWITLAITASDTWDNGNDDRDNFASGEDIVRVAREIGPVALMDFFRGELESPDPDLIIGHKHLRPFLYSVMCKLILGHAAEIFKPEDADGILALERFHRSRKGNEYVCVNPRWAMAAADLAPKRAREILLAAFERFKGQDTSEAQDMRCEIVQAYWKHEGLEGLDFVTKWFFGEKPDPTAYGFGRHRFARWLGADASRQPLLKAIILDPRTEGLDSMSFKYVILSACVSLGRGEDTRWQDLSMLREEFKKK